MTPRPDPAATATMDAIMLAHHRVAPVAGECWGWGTLGTRGRGTDRWRCQVCGRKCAGSKPLVSPPAERRDNVRGRPVVHGPATPMCWACLLWVHMSTCPHAAAIAAHLEEGNK